MVLWTTCLLKAEPNRRAKPAAPWPHSCGVSLAWFTVAPAPAITTDFGEKVYWKYPGGFASLVAGAEVGSAGMATRVISSSGAASKPKRFTEVRIAVAPFSNRIDEEH